MECTSFLCLGEPSHSFFKFRSASNILSLCAFHVVKYLRAPLMWIKLFAWSSLLGGHPFHHYHYPHLCSVPFTQPFCWTFPVSSMWPAHHSQGQLFLLWLLALDPNLTSSFITFCFLADLSWSFPSLKYPIFHMGLSLGYKNATQWHPCMSWVTDV